MRRPVLHSFGSTPVASTSLKAQLVAAIALRRAEGVLIGIIGNSKGGVGKSTTATNIGVGYHRQEKRVLIIDADHEQRSSVNWPRHLRSKNPAMVSCTPAEIVDTVAHHICDFDVILIDMAGRDERAVAQALEVADILISPTKPSDLDLPELGRFIAMAKAKTVPHITVFNEATREGSAEIEMMKMKYARFGPFLPVAIQQLSSYRRAYGFGAGVLEFKMPDPAKDNFKRVFEQLEAVIGLAHRQRRDGRR